MDRLELLQSSGLIAQETCLKAKKKSKSSVSNVLETLKDRNVYTHYALALERIKRRKFSWTSKRSRR